MKEGKFNIVPEMDYGRGFQYVALIKNNISIQIVLINSCTGKEIKKWHRREITLNSNFVYLI